jgi:hypothetical protein
VPKYIAGRPGDTLFKTSPHIPLSWQRKAIQLLAPVMGINPTLYGLPEPNHKLFEAHPTQSVELPLRLGSARHTQQVDYFHYEHDMRARELPAGMKRADMRQRVHS